jgi:Spy/CpxP family protein refolding chaperone
MKRILLVSLAVMLPLLAQPGPRAFGAGGGRGPGGGGGQDRVAFLAGYLGLTDAQKTAATAIFDAAATASTTARGTATAARDALQAGIKSGTSDAQIDQLAAAVGSTEAALTAIQAKAEAKFRALLTADQKGKLDAQPTRGRPR